MKIVKERLDEADVGDWELTEITLAGNVTRDQNSIMMKGNETKEPKEKKKES